MHGQELARQTALAAARSSRRMPSHLIVGMGVSAEANREALKARISRAMGPSIRASIALQELLAPCLGSWRRQAGRKADQFLEQEESLSKTECEGRLRPLSAFAEVLRAFDACFKVLEGRLWVPYK